MNPTTIIPFEISKLPFFASDFRGTLEPTSIHVFDELNQALHVRRLIVI